MSNGFYGEWQDPSAGFRGAPFWSWNSLLEVGRLCRQIEEMHVMGLGGFFMHSRYGLKTPYLGEEWFACVRGCIEQAERLGMKAYLYDEDRWPSGPAGGLVTREHEEYRARFLGVYRCDGGGVEDAGDVVGEFVCDVDDDGRLVGYARSGGSGVRLQFRAGVHAVGGADNNGGYLDLMNAEGVGEFIRVTHDEYSKRFGELFGDVVPAIFTDEPSYWNWCSGEELLSEGEKRVPWTGRLLDEFRDRRGYDLADHLPELFYVGVDSEFSAARHGYYRTLAELFVENYTGQIYRWCEKNGIMSTGHVLHEESLVSQTVAVGAAMQHYEFMQWPGVDILCDRAEELSTVKQCSSVASQLGKERVLSELYGCTGWDWPLEGHKFIGDWQYAAGVNLRCLHLSHYSLAGGAKRDYPASISKHCSWWRYYRVVEDYFGRLSLMLTQGRPIRDVLVIHPVESMWGLCESGRNVSTDGLTGMAKVMQDELTRITYGLCGEHYDWDYAEESQLGEYGRVRDGAVTVGEMSYKVVVVPPLVTLRASTVSLLGDFVEQGGEVVFAGSGPSRVDGKDGGDDLAGLLSKGRLCRDGWAGLVEVMGEVVDRRVSVQEGGREQDCVWSMLRSVEGGQLLFLQSHDRKAGHDVRVTVRPGSGPVVFWDALSGEKTAIENEIADDGVAFEVSLGPTGSALMSMGLDVPGVGARVEWKVVGSEKLEGPFDIELGERNSLPLDYCRYRAEGGEYSDPMPTLGVDTLIRKGCGLEAREGRDPQPWYLYTTGAVDTTERGWFELCWSFHVTDIRGDCALAIENPGDYQILVNGSEAADKAGGEDGYWVDEDIRTVDITSLVVAGDNEVVLRFNYRPDMEIEDLYLVGDFGVEQRQGGVWEPGNVTLVSPVRRLSVGSWVGQGLGFYGGSVRYCVEVTKPADGKRLRVSLPGVECAAAVIHSGGEEFVMPWQPFVADITDSLADGVNQIQIEVVGGRKNILGPLHTPPEVGTGPAHFMPDNPTWQREYLLNDHGLVSAVVVETLEIEE